MTEVTAEDLQVLAQADEDDAVLALVDGDIVVISEAELGDGRVIMTKETLYEELGEEVSDFEAVILAGRLTADLSVSEPGPADPSEPASRRLPEAEL
jgi:hypothetical protein